MSLYNQLFGFAPYHDVMLAALKVGQEDVPAYRDCFLTPDGDRLVIFTRSGGENRLVHENAAARLANYPKAFGGAKLLAGPFNDDLRRVPGFISDEDDSYDRNYAHFFYEVPEDLKLMVKPLLAAGASRVPAEMWADTLRTIKSDPAEPPGETIRTLADGLKALLDRIKGK